jgi:DNA-binding NarL/FixJ family response regulator
MRIVIVSDRPLVLSALSSIVQQIPGSHIIATVERAYAARSYCENGAAEAVVIDAFVAARDLLPGRHVTAGSLAAAVRVSPWLRPSLKEAVGAVAFLQEAAAVGARHLTPREREIFVLLGIGFSNRDISRISGLSERTVKAHVGNILAKLHVESRLQAGLVALVYCAEHAAEEL